MCLDSLVRTKLPKAILRSNNNFKIQIAGGCLAIYQNCLCSLQTTSIFRNSGSYVHYLNNYNRACLKNFTAV